MSKINIRMSTADYDQIVRKLYTLGYLTDEDMAFWPRDPLEFGKRVNKCLSKITKEEGKAK